MQIKSILNRVQLHSGFVYGAVCWRNPRTRMVLDIEIRPPLSIASFEAHYLPPRPKTPKRPVGRSREHPSYIQLALHPKRPFITFDRKFI